MKAIYTAEVSSVGGRNGHVESSDGVLKLDLSYPPLDGSTPTKTNPEQLFAAGYAACFTGAIMHVSQPKLNPNEIRIVNRVTLGTNDAGAFELAVHLDVTIPSLDQAAAEKIVEAAHEVCPYSRATRGNIEVTLTAHGGKG
jgi:osmotically inducible protein OsmC